MIFFLISLISYLIGSINSSIIITKFIQKTGDIRNLGSGNAGFTNAFRVKGKFVGTITFLGDFLKGLVAMYLSKIILNTYIKDENLILYGLYFSSLACVIGHVFPCFFKFKGGKGVLTAWATISFIDLRIFFLAISVFILVLVLGRIVSLASICAVLSYSIFTMIFDFKFIPVLISIFISITILIKHYPNIKRILKSEEKKIGSKKKAP